MSASGLYVIVEWKDKGVSMLPKEDILGENTAVNSKVTARYNNKFLDAKILYTGDFDRVNTKFELMGPSSNTKETDSPKGTGHRIMKRKTMTDFVTLDHSSEEEAPPAKKKTLQKHASAAAGEDVIEQLLSQGGRIDDDTRGSSVSINLDGVILESPDTGRVKELEAQLKAAQKRTKELEEQNNALQKNLPSLLMSLQKCVDRMAGSGQKVTSQLTSSSPVTKPTSRPPVTTKTLTKPSSPPPSVTTRPTSTPSHQPSSSLQPQQSSDEPLEELSINTALVHRAMQAKDKSKLVCNLLRCVFSRREMATSSLAGKDYAKGREVLNPKKVEAIIRIVQQKYPDCERSFIRTRITQKLKDERRAFFAGNGTENDL